MKGVENMKLENQKMKAFLRANGISAMPMYIKDGSLKHTWRLYGTTNKKDENGRPIYQKWWGNKPLINKLTALGFKDFEGKELSDISGNGGVFSVFVRGHYEFLDNDVPENPISTTSCISKDASRQVRAYRAARSNARRVRRTGQPMYY